MSISLTGILFFVFIVFMVILPALRMRGLALARRGSIRALEQKRGSRVIVLIHRQETVGLLGYPIFRFIDIEDSEQILRAIKLTDDEVPIDLILHTPGGLVLAAEQIAHAISRHPAKVTVFVPHYAMSGGTLLSLAADEIVMDDNAVLGPVDPQLGGQPAASILAVLEQKEIDKIDDQTLILADMSRKAINQVKATVTEILEHHPNIDLAQAEKMAELLATGTWTHDYPISVKEAQEMGLQVSTDMPNEVYQLMAFYAQTQQKRPSVSYIPMPYQRPGASKE